MGMYRSPERRQRESEGEYKKRLNDDKLDTSKRIMENARTKRDKIKRDFGEIARSLQDPKNWPATEDQRKTLVERLDHLMHEVQTTRGEAQSALKLHSGCGQGPEGELNSLGVKINALIEDIKQGKYLPGKAAAAMQKTERKPETATADKVDRETGVIMHVPPVDKHQQILKNTAEIIRRNARKEIMEGKGKTALESLVQDVRNGKISLEGAKNRFKIEILAPALDRALGAYLVEYTRQKRVRVPKEDRLWLTTYVMSHAYLNPLIDEIFREIMPK